MVETVLETERTRGAAGRLLRGAGASQLWVVVPTGDQATQRDGRRINRAGRIDLLVETRRRFQQSLVLDANLYAPPVGMLQLRVVGVSTLG